MTDVLALLTRSTLALSAGIALVLLVRVPVRRLSGARVAYALWLVPLLAAVAALVPKPRSAAQVPAPVAAVLQTVPPAFAQAVSSVGTLPIRSSAAPASARRAAPFALLALWASGAVASLGILAVRQRRYVRSLGRLTRVARGPAIVYQADSAAAGPALVGVLRPRIVIPADFEARFTPDEQRLVVAHERAHLRAGDAQINALAALVRSLQWFNPLVHVALRLVRIDQELACDAAVVARAPLGRRDYAAAMVKAQLEFAGLPLGSGWTARGPHPVRKRLAMLARRSPGPARRGAGALLAAALVLASGYAAWAAQPPRSATPVPTATFQPSRDRVLPGATPRPRATPQPRDTDTETDTGVATAVATLTALLAGEGQSLVEAAQDGDIEAVRRLIAAGANLDAHRPGDGTALVEAARRGNLAIVTLLLDHGANPDAPAPGDGNPLIMAAAGGHLDVVTLLVLRGADVDGYVPGDETPLINAAGNGHLAVVRHLVEQGASVNLAFDVRSWDGRVERRSPLGQAIAGGHRTVAAYLREAGATP